MIGRVWAEFHPEAWQNDQAVPVDPEGPTEWNASERFLLLDGSPYVQRLAHQLVTDDGEGVVDVDDMFKDDKNAPEWVRQWSGPFTIRLWYMTPGPVA